MAAELTERKGVFVTQLHERQDESELPVPETDTDENTKQYVKRNAGKLIENGLNTMQKTLLLKKHIEVEHIDEELRHKTAEFDSRTSASVEKRHKLQHEQERMKGQVSKFEKYISEYNVRRQRAIQKYQQEVRLKELKHREYLQLCAELEVLKQRQGYLKKKLDRYKKFEVYLNKAVALLPDHYLEVQDTVLNSLMMRHNTLSATKKDLMENLINMTDEYEAKKLELDELQQNQDKMKVTINSELSSLLNAKEQSSGVNREKEHKFVAGKVEFRSKRTEYASIMMSIDNIAEKCRHRTEIPVYQIPLDQRLAMIQDFINERAEVVRRAAPLIGNTAPNDNVDD